MGAITLALSPTSAGEAADATTVTVTATLPGSTTRGENTDITVTVGGSGDEATEGTDYATVADFTLTIPAGSRTGTAIFSIDPTQDAVDEGAGEKVSVGGTTTASGLTVSGADFTITDDDDPGGGSVPTPGINVVPTSLTVAEGGTKTYTVTLATRPSTDVTVTPTSMNPAAVTFTPDSVTIKATEWSAPQTFTVRGVEDEDKDEDSAMITHEVSGYGSMTTAESVAVTVTEDDPAADPPVTSDQPDPQPPLELPGIVVEPTEITLMEGDSATYTVVLMTQPIGAVTVTPLRSHRHLIKTVEMLTFTPEDWNEPQTVMVRTRSDADAYNDRAMLSHTVSGYGDMTEAEPVMVNIMDGDTPGVTVKPTELTLMEGDTAAYSVVLDTRPAGPVTVTTASRGSGAADVNETLTFTPENWNTAQTVTLTAAEDDDAYDEEVEIAHAVAGYDGVTTAPPVAVTVTDDETAGVTIEPTELILMEGDTAAYSVVLDTRPAGPVTVTPSSGDPDAADVNETLTFTPDNWNTAQTVTLTTAEDDDAYDEGVEIAHAVTGYDEVTTAPPVAVTVTDDETAGVTVEPTELILMEGDTAAYSVVLDTRPAGPVTVTPASSDPDAADVNETLTFTPDNWNTAQTLTVIATEDDDAYDEEVEITHAVAGYDEVTTSATVAVTVADDETAGVTVAPAELTLVEGGTGAYTVVLDTRPAGPVTVTPASGDPDAADVDGTLTFTPDNWNEAQTVTVTAAEDDDAYDEAVTISNSVAGYREVTAAPAVEVAVVDDDTAGVIVAPTELTVAEGGAEAYSVVLDTRPARTVTVTPTSSNASAAPASAPLTFDASNWNIAQTVVVAAAHDDDAYDERLTIRHTVSGYDQVNRAAAVEVAITDDDTAGVTIEPTELTIDEGGAGVYTVVLDTRPARTVTVTPTSNEALAVVSGPVTFAPEEWNQPRRVTVTVGEDAGVADELARITHAVEGYDEVATAADVQVTLADNDLAPDPDLMTDLARALADQRVGAITRRFDQTGSSAGGGSAQSLALAGGGPGVGGRYPSTGGGFGSPGHYPAIGGGAGRHGRFPASGTNHGQTWHPVGRQALGNIDFMLPLADCAAADSSARDASADAAASPDCTSPFSLWGRGDYRSLSGQAGDASWNGDLLTAHLGADVRLSDRWLAGLAASWTQSLLRYGNAGKDDLYELDLATVHPYARWARSGWELWATGGYGTGTMRINARSSNQVAETNINTRTAAMGLRARVGQIGATTFRLKGEGLGTSLEVADNGRQGVGIGGLAVDASRLRLTVEASRPRALESGAQLLPVLELGAVHDGGDGVTGTGAELGGGLSYEASNRRLSLASSARVLVRDDHTEWGGEAAFEVKPRADERGFSFTLRPSVGNSRSGIQALWEHGLREQTLQYQDDDPLQLEVRLGYGLRAPGGAVTLLGELSRMYGADTYGIGAEWRIKQQLQVKLVGERRERPGERPDHAILVRGTLRLR